MRGTVIGAGKAAFHVENYTDGELCWRREPNTYAVYVWVRGKNTAGNTAQNLRARGKLHPSLLYSNEAAA